ncbi:ethylene-responsive transcription factor ERF017-like [Trifolium pratense]|uniref:ethylene-responsive transcription factor ERF017-like n=1 Tax=Trifolium pratense TaxID=57577 RepID=UPI001E697805|nr:ethylene-responsive transcription factor ERF017-like [Trifolium pratense]
MDINQVTTHQIKTSSSSSSTLSGNNKKYKGVRLRKWGKWVCEIRLPNSRERIWLGSYDSAEKAARAFDAALYCLRGPNAAFNFPDTPFNLDINVASNNSLTHQEIREIAANFANKNLPIVIDNNNNNVNINNNGNGNVGNGNVDESNIVKEISGSSSSTMNVNGNMIDWTFLNMLDGSSDNVGTENYGGFYSDLEKMHSGELLYSIPPPFFEDYNHQNEIVDDDNDDPFSHQSFLWNWNF